jgi:NTP pyrophosphatase (non-canonical NTP hydrolase)
MESISEKQLQEVFADLKEDEISQFPKLIKYSIEFISNGNIAIRKIVENGTPTPDVFLLEDYQDVEGESALKILNRIYGHKTTLDQSDKLDTLFNNQKQLMNVLGMSTEPEPDILDSSLFKDILICAVGECMEALEPLAVKTKPWKHAENKDGVREHIKEEIVDILFFVLELFIMAGLSPEDVVRRYTAKQQKNLVRAAGRSKSAEVVAVKLFSKFDTPPDDQTGKEYEQWLKDNNQKETYD